MSLLRAINTGIKFREKHPQKTILRPGPPTAAIKPAIARLGYGGERYSFPDWTEKYFYDPTTVNMFGRDWDYSQAKTILLDPAQREITNHVLTPNSEGYFPYQTVVYSTIKKEGKTTLAGAVGAWWSAQVEPPNLTLCLANDQEQSAGRIFGAMLPTFYKLGAQCPLAQSSKPEIRLQNGTIIQAIANNYAGNAGANYGLTLWSELWAYTSERSRRLFEELIPVPTRKNSIRWIETYVGFEDESDLMLDLFLRIFQDTAESAVTAKARPVPGLEHITTDHRPACWHIPEEGLFYYHNHEPRMPWNIGVKGEKYRAAQKADLRYSQYVRLHENRWQSSEGSFIIPEEYEDAVTLEVPTKAEPMILAGDASQRNDTIFLIGTNKYHVKVFGEIQERYKLLYCRVWDPKMYGAKADRVLGTKKGDMDLEETIAEEIYRLYHSGLMIGPFRYDPYQLHQVAVNLRKRRVPCVEFPQQTERLKSDTFLNKLFKKGLIDLYPHATLEQHVKHAKAKEFDNEQLRIVKGTLSHGNKVDGAVALAMSVYVASKFRPENTKKKTSSRRLMV
jgi:hypothetical protein